MAQHFTGYYDLVGGQALNQGPMFGTNGLRVYPKPKNSTAGEEKKDWGQWAKDNAPYIGGAALIGLGLAAWKFDWFR